MEELVLDDFRLEIVHVGNALVRKLKRRKSEILCYTDTRQLREQIKALDRAVPAGSRVWVHLGDDRRRLQS